ncbi:hypothetical protein WJX73_004672 [Symbiochloris irregularis]|uniref:J domain-containing protein n=1 Tax=Symbiochloris irregularis TaxID=706552 RepID=A0AAW1PJN1_9CHLO
MKRQRWVVARLRAVQCPLWELEQDSQFRHVSSQQLGTFHRDRCRTSLETPGTTMGIRDPYEQLGVPHGIKHDDLMEAFAQKCSELDPDDPSDTLELKSLEEAFEIIDDPARRKEYDQGHGSSSHGQGSATSHGQDGKQQKQQSSDSQSGSGAQDLQGKVAGKVEASVPAGVKEKLGVAQEKLGEAQGRVDQAKKGDGSYADVIPEEVLGKISDLLSDTLGNGQLFEPYVGQVATAAGTLANKAAGQLSDDKPKVSDKEVAARQEKIQEEREAVLANILRQKLQPYLDGKKDEFRDGIREEARQLTLLPFGTALLHAIGSAYEMAAKPFIGSAVSAWFTSKAHKLSTNTGALKAKAQGVTMYVSVRHFGTKERKGIGGKMTVAEAGHYLEGRMGWVITAIWNLLVKDLEDTLRHVTRAVLTADDVDEETKSKRAQALWELGDIFSEAKRQEDTFKITGAGGLDALQDHAKQLQGAAAGKADEVKQDVGGSSASASGGVSGGGSGSGAGGGSAGGVDTGDLEGQAKKAEGHARKAVGENVPSGDEAHKTVESAGKEQVQPAAKAVGDKAKPMADNLADEKVRPAAKAVGDRAEGAADEASDNYIRPAADTVAKQAEPMAQKATEEHLKPAAKQVSQQAKPTAEKVKGQAIDPAAKAVKDNAVPLADRADKEAIKPAVGAVKDNAEPLAERATEEGIKPAAKAIHENAVPVTKDVTEQLKPILKDNAAQLQPLADKLANEHLKPGGQQLADNLEPAAKQFTQEKLQPGVQKALAELEKQAGMIAKEGPELAKKLPPSIRKACDKKKVPEALRDDLKLLADLLDKYVVPKAVDFAKQAPEKAQEAREKVEPAVDKASKVIEEQAAEAAPKIKPAADKTADNIQGTAKAFSEKADVTADKLGEAAVEAAERTAELAVPTGDKASDALKKGAKHANQHADEYGDKVSTALKDGAQQATDTADDTAAQAKRHVDRAAEEVEQNAEPAAQEASDHIHRGAKTVAEKAPQAGEQASKGVKDAAQTVKKEAPRAGDQAAQAIKQGGDTVSTQAEPAAQNATGAVAQKAKGAVDAVHKVNKGEMSASEATDKLAQQITEAPDKVADLVSSFASDYGVLKMASEADSKWKQAPASTPGPSKIVFTSPSPSPLRFQLIPIAKELIRRGHTVYVVNVYPPNVSAECEAAGIVLLKSAPPDFSKLKKMQTVFKQWSGTDWLGPDAQAWRMVECVADFYQDFDSIFQSSYQAGCDVLDSMDGRPDLVIMHGFDDAWQNVAYNRGLNYAIFTPLPVGLRGRYGDVPAAPSGVYPVSAQQARTFQGRATKLVAYWWMFLRQLRSKVAVNLLKRRMGIKTYLDVNATWRGHSVISTWPWGLEPAREVSPQFHHVGFPCVPWKAPKDLTTLSAESQSLIAWLDDNMSNGVIFLAYGSMLKMGWMMEAKRHHAMVTAVAAFAAAKGAKMLISIPPYEGDTEAIKGVLRDAGAAEGTIRQEPWVDQSMVLEHAATRVLVCHCGQMSVGNAVVSRTPILAVPLTTDGYTNAMRVQDAGVGLVVNIHGFTRDDVGAKLHRLWQESGFQAGLQRHYHINQQGGGPINRAADVIEMELLTGSKHLTPLDEHLPWLLKTNADIYALLVFLALLFVVLPFVMVPIAGVVVTLLFVKSRSR